MLAVPSNRFTAPVPVGNVANITLDSASQVTEQYRSAYSQKASQASASLLNSSAQHQLPSTHASATARQGTPSTRAVLPCHTDISSAMMILLVESLKYTGCGDAFAQLKDPSGSIGAGIHAQVLQAEEGLSPGAVLMLQQVALTAVSTSSSTPFVPLSGWLSLNERGQVAPSAFPLLTFDVACQVPLLVLSKTLKYLCITVENIVQHLAYQTKAFAEGDDCQKEAKAHLLAVARRQVSSPAKQLGTKLFPARNYR
ncbi:MAG: hypothetical protein FRX49_09512 [Trebouxia sp. A1-2]|nr:MAG: hypothetical protein FRX49_09512 [Trebouxia sp. A1-2]